MTSAPKSTFSSAFYARDRHTVINVFLLSLGSANVISHSTYAKRTRIIFGQKPAKSKDRRREMAAADEKFFLKAAKAKVTREVR